ncbi:hypothetical protein HC928_22525, partial [bacterium]|nr:hypothetical protein [bacterium]
IELLGSRDNIAHAKSELLYALGTDGVAVINADNEYCGLLELLGNKTSFGTGFSNFPTQFTLHPDTGSINPLH